MEPPTGLLAPNCFKWTHCFPSTMQNWILLTMAPSPICLPLNPSPMRPPGFKGHHYNSGSCVPTKMCLMKLVTSALSPTLQKHRDSEEGFQIKRNPSIFAVKQWSFPLGSPCLPRHIQFSRGMLCIPQRVSMGEEVHPEGNQLSLEAQQCAGQCNWCDSYLTSFNPCNTLNYIG